MELSFIIFKNFNKRKKDKFYLNLDNKRNELENEFIDSLSIEQLKKFRKYKTIQTKVNIKEKIELIDYSVDYYNKLNCKY